MWKRKRWNFSRFRFRFQLPLPLPHPWLEALSTHFDSLAFVAISLSLFSSLYFYPPVTKKPFRLRKKHGCLETRFGVIDTATVDFYYKLQPRRNTCCNVTLSQAQQSKVHAGTEMTISQLRDGTLSHETALPTIFVWENF